MPFVYLNLTKKNKYSIIVTEKEFDSTMDLYFINKMAQSQVPDMTQKDYKKAAKEVWDTLKYQKDTKYLMLLCRERHDYTVFKVNDLEEDYTQLWNEILDILQNHRNFRIKDIFPDAQGNIEYWIVTEDTNECFMYLLFNYDWGVIEL